MTGTLKTMVFKRIIHIGTGPWGKNYLTAYKDFPVSVTVATRDTWKQLIEEMPDGVVICTPPDTHCEIAQHALTREIPVMIEKPLALSYNEAKMLSVYRTPILVNHIYLFSAQYQALKSSVAGMRPIHIETVGIGSKSHDGYSVLWDYGPHDIAIALDLMENSPNQVLATKQELADGQIYDVELSFGESAASLRFGLGTSRERRVRIESSKGEAVFEDSGAEVPSPLHNAIGTFLLALDGERDSRLGVDFALEVLHILEACDQSLKLGEPVPYEFMAR